MGKRHQRTDFDRARDEMFSLVHRCDVLDAAEQERKAWVKETVEYMAGRYPTLKKMELVKLETVGRNFCAPVIRHGAGSTAVSRDEQESEQVQAA
ncbi:MAG: hypothetical protein ACRELV_02885 [Longimicrobiales bacterium]